MSRQQQPWALPLALQEMWEEGLDVWARRFPGVYGVQNWVEFLCFRYRTAMEFSLGVSLGWCVSKQ
jgi:hypothetical protein